MTAWSGNDDTAMTPVAQHTYAQSLNTLDSERVARYKLLWEYYRGEHRKHLKVRMTPAGTGPDDNVVINLSRRVVNKGVTFLFGKPLVWQLSETGQTAEEDMLERIWGSPEKRMAFFAELAMNGGVTGDAYLQIVPPQPGQDLPTIVNLNPAVVFPKTNPNDINDVWGWDIRWMVGTQVHRTIHAKREDGQAWESWDEVYKAGKWERVTEPALWTFDWPMIIHIKNLPNPNSFYGLSDLEDADLNDAINLVASNINRISRIFAHPITWAYGFGRSNEGIDISKMALSDDPQAKMGALELGRDLSSAQEYLKFLRTAFAEITGVPESDPDRMAIGAQSGFALKVLFNDLILKTELKRSLYGTGIVECNRRLLDLMGMGSNNIVTLHWGDPLPVDENAETASDKFDLDAGLASKETVSTRRGYDWKVEQERMKKEEPAKPQTVPQTMLQTVPQTVQGEMVQ